MLNGGFADNDPSSDFVVYGNPLPHTGFNIADRVRLRFEVPDLAQVHDQLTAWFATPVGRHMLERERAFCRAHLSALGGYRLAHLGVSPPDHLLASFSQLHKFALFPASAVGIASVCDFDALPLPGDSVDVVLLHHALDFSPNPHAVLSEAARVANPGGHIALFGFNPVSLLGLGKWPAVLFSKHPVWRRNSLRAGRALDWLRLLGLQPVMLHWSGYPLAQNSPDKPLNPGLHRLARNAKLPFGLFYVLVARKQVIRPTAIAPPAWVPLRVPSLAINGCRRATPNS